MDLRRMRRRQRSYIWGPIRVTSESFKSVASGEQDVGEAPPQAYRMRRSLPISPACGGRSLVFPRATISGAAFMTVSQTTTSATEAEFEAEIRGAVERAFPWLNPMEIEHQTTFSFTFGHATVVVDGRIKERAQARADIIIRHRGKPLAVMELKRHGADLTRDDGPQALSYARVLQPWPPLVVVTNGRQTRFIETFSGDRREPESLNEASLQKLMENAAVIAAEDMKQAVATLMGNDPAVWMQAVRQATKAAIDEMTGGWDDPFCRFVDGFLLPRRSTWMVQQALKAGQRSVVVGGAPLAGKSSLLRELSLRLEDGPDFAVLFLDADPGLELFQSVALWLAQSLDWPATSDDARHWMTKLSRAGGPALVLAIDNPGLDNESLRRDLDTLTSNMFGPGIRVVVAADHAVARKLVTARNERSLSAFGKRSDQFGLLPMDEEEFKKASERMLFSRMRIMRGGSFSPELRKPWVLRTMCAEFATSPEYAEMGLGALIPPLIGIELIGFVRRSFDVSSGPNARYCELGKALLEDVRDDGRSAELRLEQLETYLVRRATLLRHLAGLEIQELIATGLLRESKSATGESVYVALLPELLASETAKLVADDLLACERANPERAVDLLVKASRSMPLGDVVAAQAIVDAVVRNNGLDLRIITSLLDTPPRRETLSAGTRTRMFAQGVGFVDLTLQENGGALIAFCGKEETVPGEEGGEHVTYVDMDPWLILSHVAGRRIGLVVDGKLSDQRVDPFILMNLAACPMPLRGVVSDIEMSGLPVHELSSDLTVVCHDAGIVEPVAWALFSYLSDEKEADVDAFIDEALSRGEPPLLGRLDLVLRELGRTTGERAAWAERTLRERVTPAFDDGLRVAVMHD